MALACKVCSIVAVLAILTLQVSSATPIGPFNCPSCGCNRFSQKEKFYSLLRPSCPCTSYPSFQNRFCTRPTEQPVCNGFSYNLQLPLPVSSVTKSSYPYEVDTPVTPCPPSYRDFDYQLQVPVAAKPVYKFGPLEGIIDRTYNKCPGPCKPEFEYAGRIDKHEICKRQAADYSSRHDHSVYNNPPRPIDQRTMKGQGYDPIDVHADVDLCKPKTRLGLFLDHVKRRRSTAEYFDANTSKSDFLSNPPQQSDRAANFIANNYINTMGSVPGLGLYTSLRNRSRRSCESRSVECSDSTEGSTDSGELNENEDVMSDYCSCGNEKEDGKCECGANEPECKAKDCINNRNCVEII